MQRHRDLESKLSRLSSLGDHPGRGVPAGGQSGQTALGCLCVKIPFPEGQKGGPEVLLWFSVEFPQHLELSDPGRRVVEVGCGEPCSHSAGSWLSLALPRTKAWKNPAHDLFHHHALVN